MRITHIIFDLDGTLIDTVKASLEACLKTAEEFGFPRLTEEALMDAMGLPGPDFFRKLLPGMENDKLLEFARYADAAENALIRQLGKAVLFDGIEAMLTELSGRGKKLFIASTGSLEHVNTALSATGIRAFFTGVYCDHPDKTQSIGRIDELRKGGEWLMVGDKRIDANAARHHGIFSIGAGYGYCDPGERNFFDKIVFSPDELLEFVR
jgi:phosphoglycolate phosphatase-like HAD superfamily hydrolase